MTEAYALSLQVVRDVHDRYYYVMGKIPSRILISPSVYAGLHPQNNYCGVPLVVHLAFSGLSAATGL